MENFFDTKIEFLKGVGPQKAALLNTELSVFTFRDLLEHFPFRHEDRSTFYHIAEANPDLPYIQVKGRVQQIGLVGAERKQRLVATFADDTGEMELVWFQGIKWVREKVKPGLEYIVFGKPARFGHSLSITHPEIEPLTPAALDKAGLEPVYSSTAKLTNKGLDSRGIARLQRVLLELAFQRIPETLPLYLIARYRFLSKQEAVLNAHFPPDEQLLTKARARLRFEELLFVQLKMLGQKHRQTVQFPGQVFGQIPTLKSFYNEYLPFELTEAQKRVIREIFADFKSGKQMNRLLQGDVGSGKTIVAFICMLMAIDNGAQACLMAPTEILADQHYTGLKTFADLLGISIRKLTGSTRKKERKEIDEQLRSGQLHIIVGTHALIEDAVDFHNLGLCVIDEQHRFGVAQRAKLWKKTSVAYPHILVMTATPIPRTLAMTLYGDLDVSVIDELPAGRKPIKTVHRYESGRLRVFGFIKEQIELGRQIYIVYPLIEESEKLDYNNLMEGYESIARAFPGVPLSIVHGKMKPADKDFEMQRFIKAETKIMVATTVIEVGVNVPNASVMVIENAEKFGLAQLHQLRGRVGRGAEQSYCILMTGHKISKDSKIRLETMVSTNNGFEIADVDLKLRGPGDLAGTQQSGVLDLKFTDLAKDSAVVKEARTVAETIIAQDPELQAEEHRQLRHQLSKMQEGKPNWSRIS